MIDKKILFSTLVIAFFAGCDAGEDIQEFIDDTKKKYLEEQVGLV